MKKIGFPNNQCGDGEDSSPIVYVSLQQGHDSMEKWKQDVDVIVYPWYNVFSMSYKYAQNIHLCYLAKWVFQSIMLMGLSIIYYLLGEGATKDVTIALAFQIPMENMPL